MTAAIDRPIRFIHAWRQFKPGDVNTSFDFGVKDALVTHRRVAEWVEDQPKVRRQQTVKEPTE